MKHYVIFLIFLLCLSTSLYATDSRYEGRTIAAAENLKYVMDVQNAPLALLKNASCVASFKFVRAGFVFGARYGNGVTSCKLAGGGWSAPSMSRISGLSTGFQVGVAEVDIVVFIMDETSKMGLIDGKLDLDVGANISFGEDGRGGNIDFEEPVYTVMNTKGVFVGVTIDAQFIQQASRDNGKIYGRELTSYEILTKSIEPPPGLGSFTSTLSSYQ